LQFGIRIDRRARQINRYGQPPPHGGDRALGYQEKRQRCTQFRPPGQGSSINRNATLTPQQQKVSGCRYVLTSENCRQLVRAASGELSLAMVLSYRNEAQIFEDCFALA
jgi:hypothetical protein